MLSTNIYQSYEPCYEDLLEIGGLSFQYNQMYSLSKDKAPTRISFNPESGFQTIDSIKEVC